jgi:hypothetical protein
MAKKNHATHRIHLFEDFIDQPTEDALLASLSSLPLQPVTIRGNASKRTVGHFGLRYDYGSRILRECCPRPLAAPDPGNQQRTVLADHP